MAYYPQDEVTDQVAYMAKSRFMAGEDLGEGLSYDVVANSPREMSLRVNAEDGSSRHFTIKIVAHRGVNDFG